MEILKRRYPLMYTTGEVHMVNFLSLYHAEELKLRFNDLLVYLIARNVSYVEDNDQLVDLYLNDILFKYYIDEIFGILKIDIEKIDIEEVFTLILPYKKPDNKLTNYGKLLEFIFESPEKEEDKFNLNKKDEDSEPQKFTTLIGNVWALTKNMEEVLFLIKTFSSKDVNEILEARAEAETPVEMRNKKKAQEKAKKTIERLTKQSQKKVVKKELNDREIDSILDKFM